MNFQTLRFLVVWFSPLVASSVVAISPAQAATLALSESGIEFSNFNLDASSTSTTTNTNAETFSTNGTVVSVATANAVFIEKPAGGINVASNQVVGDGEEYSGLANSVSTVAGSFLVQHSLSFNFTALLNLATAIDDASRESASALGGIAFQLLDAQQNVLDTFGLFGQVGTPGHADLFEQFVSCAIALSPTSTVDKSFGGQNEFIQAAFQGTYQRTFNFDTPTMVTLVEVQGNQANVAAVPEPTTLLGIGLAGAIGAVLKRRSGQRA